MLLDVRHPWLLPAGHPQYELIPGGSDMEVTAANAGEYIAAVVNATLSEGIEKQMEAFRQATLP